ncbi:MAG: putative 2OG-Fe(II) oxygenase [Wenzhouxiangella sp.]
MTTSKKPDLAVTSAFSVPLIHARHKAPQKLNEALATLFRQRAQSDAYRNPEPRFKRNQALFESRFNLFDWPETCVRELRDFCFGQLFHTIRELNGYDEAMLKDLRYACESWFHLTHKGGFFAAHTHSNHSWSGVYCVRHDGDDPASDSGRLCFLNPNPASNMYVDAGIAQLKRPFSGAPIMLRLEPGQLVLFPSWLLHEVTPYEGETERITVAFNVRFQYVGTQTL